MILLRVKVGTGKCLLKKPGTLFEGFYFLLCKKFSWVVVVNQQQILFYVWKSRVNIALEQSAGDFLCLLPERPCTVVCTVACLISENRLVPPLAYRPLCLTFVSMASKTTRL